MTASEPKQDWADRTEQRLLDAAILRAADLGFSPALLKAAGEACDLSEGDVGLLLPNGPADLVALLSRRHDEKTMEILAGLDVSKVTKIRQKIFEGVERSRTRAPPEAAAPYPSRNRPLRLPGAHPPTPAGRGKSALRPLSFQGRAAI